AARSRVAGVDDLGADRRSEGTARAGVPDVNRTARLLLVVAASGIPAAFVWWALARPSQWMATDRGLILTEANATGRFQVVAVFTVIGTVLGLLAGWWVHRQSRPGTWRVVLGLAAAASVASLVCWRLGARLGPV